MLQYNYFAIFSRLSVRCSYFMVPANRSASVCVYVKARVSSHITHALTHTVEHLSQNMHQ